MHIVILSSVWVEPNSSAAGARMLQLIRLFVQQNWQVTYASTSKGSVFAVDLTIEGVSITTVLLNDSSFDEFIKERNPDIVIFDRFMLEEQFGWRVVDSCPNALRILDTEDLHCLREARRIALKDNRDFQESDLLELPIAKREVASILRCDLVLVISTYEMQLLEDVFKIDKALLFYIPFLLPKLSSTVFDKLPSFEERKDFYFVGNFLHKPNYDTVLYLKTTIWPVLSKQLPQAKLYIYGAYLTDKAKQLDNPKQRFYVMGRATDLPKIIQQAKVCLAPIRFGAGIKGKLVEAMQLGTPSVTTTIGAEAMAAGFPWSGVVANTTDTIVAATIELYTSKTKWLVAQQNGLEIINTIYDKAKYDASLIETLVKLKQNLATHRKRNFLGAILQLESMRSAKFMSMWIEQKNKKSCN